MSKLGETKFSAQSGLVCERLGELTGLAGAALESATAFGKADTKLQQLCFREGTTGAAKDQAMAEVIDFDVDRDVLIPDVAAALVGAKVTKPTSPLKGFSKYSPSVMSKLQFSVETKVVEEFCATIREAKVPASVKALAARLHKANKKVEVATKAFDKAAAAHSVAVAARNEFMPTWQKAMSNLRVQMKAALHDQPGAYEALFAAPESAPPPKPRKQKKA